ncbi:MAG: helix-turn-helix domain-containing protein [Alphaproteobacteria bacterium]|nr:helix-turn-helix domain-containing protein [Alphaproteobacteria bacterium]MBU6473299.1 helix-turn-helix domain-containing protein [Alphaproteobacteria bacterium]MDE2011659.1 helix-turn-helix domain-containing protein [Alphaproteobacteria bacterium]MDE2074682.1 helix-turn-helix domain-containing protein [Alphaproteobacteria bacterium]MDE2352320.1 helix-turn-helix domain-containing protein [Alphaproteobacteria bacterium]
MTQALEHHDALARHAAHEVAVGSVPHAASADDALFPLNAVSTVLRFGRNQTIFNEGDDARYSYKIVEGGVRVCKVRPDGRRQIAEFLLPGDLFGFEAGEEHSLTAEALCNVVVMRCPRKHVERLSEEVPNVRRTLMMLLRRELSAAQDHLVMLGRQSARERLASFLLQLAERTDSDNGDTLDLPMGRQDIADFLGLTIETVCRALTELKRERVITIPNRHQVVIRNMDALEAVAEGAEV